MSLKRLIKKCKKQDIKAQEQLYRLFAGKLFSLCLKYCTNYSAAEDTLQDSFITIFAKIDQYKGKGSFEGWLKRITINTALQKYRKQKVFDIVDEDLIIDTEVAVEEDEISLNYLLQLIQELPDRYRLVFNLYVLDEYSHKEIAKMLNISVGTSKSNLARARHILKEKIETKQHSYFTTIKVEG
ncbi:RNA polymerase sigma factor [Aquimarina brevivitae]|uniref:RNA polymerase sigma-70 factor (ECF subfamily) n=1 Tax=Aquimarina brevivitae TaxID=323412 RepID=A0A4Q7PFC6_9FLAO|nr:RNA polymerase sigma factor [Aquimarina brevivitae]RZS99193.1 RNA polymerase sigma-70 factor (ECF subfamily) [Aquimarina brevivitae]